VSESVRFIRFSLSDAREWWFSLSRLSRNRNAEAERQRGALSTPGARTGKLDACVGGSKGDLMGFCDHCEGQRFDRARVLRALRNTRKRLREDPDGSAARAVAAAIEAVRALDIPHLELLNDSIEGEVIH
jgi:hypothetical protein